MAGGGGGRRVSVSKRGGKPTEGGEREDEKRDSPEEIGKYLAILRIRKSLKKWGLEGRSGKRK